MSFLEDHSKGIVFTFLRFSDVSENVFDLRSESANDKRFMECLFQVEAVAFNVLRSLSTFCSLSELFGKVIECTNGTFDLCERVQVGEEGNESCD